MKELPCPDVVYRGLLNREGIANFEFEIAKSKGLNSQSAIRNDFVHPEGVEPPTSISTGLSEHSEAKSFVEMRIPPKGGTSDVCS